MAQLFGKFDEKTDSQEYLTFGFVPSLVDPQQQWQKNGWLSDLLAEYVAISFLTAVSDPSSSRKQKKIKSLVSYIANELLQNAMQYHDEAFDDIGVKLQLHDKHLTLQVTNSIPSSQVEKFQSFIQKLLTTNLEELYIQQMTQDADEDETMTSGLGLVTIIQDYSAQLGWKFETLSPESKIIMVTTMVQLAI